MCIFTLISYLVLPTSFAQLPLIATSGPSHVRLVELYTSTRDYMSPPADAWFSQLKDTKGIWEEFVPVVFPDGYGEPFGKRKNPNLKNDYDLRQAALAENYPTGKEIYSPQFVIDGVQWREWRDSNHVLPKFESSSDKIVLSIFKNNRPESYLVKVTAPQIQKNYQICFSPLKMKVQAHPTQNGINENKPWTSDFVVMKLDCKNLKKGASQIEYSAKNWKPDAIAAWLQTEDDPRPLQATGAFLTFR